MTMAASFELWKQRVKDVAAESGSRWTDEELEDLLNRERDLFLQGVTPKDAYRELFHGPEEV